MSARVIITFAYAGIEPPIYVVTSASSPPWEILEMNISSELTKEGDNIYYRVLDGVAPGDYQYKIRAGSGTWMIDASKETGKPLPPPSTPWLQCRRHSRYLESFSKVGSVDGFALACPLSRIPMALCTPCQWARGIALPACFGRVAAGTCPRADESFDHG
jgi:hypothetical protein